LIPPLLYCDESVIAIDKPAGMLSVPGRGEDKQDCAARRVQHTFADALVVHRLDMATSGILLFARSTEAQRRVSMAFESREVHKRYVAVVKGIVAEPEGLIDLPLMSDWPNRPKQKVDPLDGRPSQTRYRRLSVDAVAGTTRLELEPITGRSHQLRVHLLEIGHPIVGDTLYAPDGASRLMLHASELSLPHPLRGTVIRITSEPPF
jgi:tRNA pseudouridine32 synthase / 23S rRNA pseudouridine746 synthase